jgi:hypothetical protein
MICSFTQLMVLLGIFKRLDWLFGESWMYHRTRTADEV